MQPFVPLFLQFGTQHLLRINSMIPGGAVVEILRFLEFSPDGCSVRHGSVSTNIVDSAAPPVSAVEPTLSCTAWLCIIGNVVG